MSQSLQDSFSFFTMEINKYTSGVHFLNSGICLKNIERLENDLSIRLPQQYKGFLELYNGGELFRPGTVLAEVYNDTMGSKTIGTPYLNDWLKKEKRTAGMPDNLLIIANMNYGDLICIALSKTDKDEYKVVQWSHEEKSVSRVWNSFKEWLIDVLDEGKMLVDYNGDEKELEF